jgi:hypothetical protein
MLLFGEVLGNYFVKKGFVYIVGRNISEGNTGDP